jgi:hypothetical protein
MGLDKPRSDGDDAMHVAAARLPPAEQNRIACGGSMGSSLDERAIPVLHGVFLLL